MANSRKPIEGKFPSRLEKFHREAEQRDKIFQFKEKIRTTLNGLAILLTLGAIIFGIYLYFEDKKFDSEFKATLKESCIESCFENERNFDICNWRCRNTDR